MTDKRKEYQKEYHKHYRYTETRKRVSLSLTTQEHKQLAYLAKLRNQKPASTAAEVIRGYLSQDPMMSKGIEAELRGIKQLIRNVANNVNQIAHRSNTLQVMVDEHELLAHIQQLETLILDFVKQNHDH